MTTIFSIIISSIIAIIITWYFTRKQMKKNEITHFFINSYDVGKGLHNEFPKFQLTYDNKELPNEVLVLKGGFINTGRNDITGLKNDSDINIILPKGSSVREIKIKQLSDDLGVTIRNNKDPNIISIGIDEKFMSGESFEYTAIIETTDEIKNFHSNIEFKHRIPNTSKIKNKNIIDQLIRTGNSITPDPFEKTMGFAILMLSLILCILSISFIFLQKVQYNLIEKESGEEFSMYIMPGSQLFVSDNDIIPFYGFKKITKEELKRNYELLPKTDFSWSNNDSLTGIACAFMAFLYFVCSIFLFYLWHKNKRIYQLLKQYE